MKGLLYKDFCVAWKQLKSVLFMIVIFCLIPSGDFGLGRFFVLYSTLMIPLSLMSYDERSRWDSLAVMLPYSSRQIVLGKYICSWAAMVFAIGMYWLGQTMAAARGTSDGITSLLLIAACAFLLQTFYFPILFKMGTEKGRYVMLVVIMVVAVLAALLYEAASAFGVLLAPILLVVSAVLCLVSVPVSVKQYEKRAW